MSAEEFNELAGRIDGLAKVVMALIADMENREAINGPRFCHRLRVHADELENPPGERLETSKRTIRQIADYLDEARANRLQSDRRYP